MLQIRRTLNCGHLKKYVVRINMYSADGFLFVLLGVNIFQRWIFFRGEYFSEANVVRINMYSADGFLFVGWDSDLPCPALPCRPSSSPSSPSSSPSSLVGILICLAQLCLAGRIIRAKTDVPIFNQLFVLCLIVSGFITNNATIISS